VCITVCNKSRSLIALSHSCQCQCQVCKSWQHKKKTYGSGNSDVLPGVSSVNSNNTVKVSHTRKDLFHRKSLQKMY
jgi:hypothetical protein